MIKHKNLRIEVFTIGVGDSWGKIAHLTAEHFDRLNGTKTRILNATDLKERTNLPPRHATWLKAWLWDIAKPETDYVFFYDADTVCMSPLDFGLIAQGNLRACHNTIFGDPPWYMNSGVFAHNRTLQPVMEQLKTFYQEWKPYHAGEERAFNKAIQINNTHPNWLPQTYNWMYGYSSHAKILHFACRHKDLLTQIKYAIWLSKGRKIF